MLKDALPEPVVDAPLPLPRVFHPHEPEPSAVADESGLKLDRDLLRRNHIWAFEPHDVRARSFIMLRSQFMSRFYAPGGRILAVTSTMPHEGKTFVVANLAVALSQIHPTIAIDLDLRRPTLARRFGLIVDRGVDDVFAGRALWADSAVPITANLTIHGVREAVATPTETLASDRLREIFHDLRQLPGEPLCIVDTPPILMLDDASLITRHIDGALMVIDEGKTRASDLKKAIASLADAKVIGSILNRSITTSRSDIDYAYYEYHQNRS